MTREEAIDVLKLFLPSTCSTDLCKTVEIAIQTLSTESTADVRENVKGEWIKHYIHHGSTSWGYDCSVCGHWVVVGEEKIKDYNFCPNCGVQMVRGEP